MSVCIVCAFCVKENKQENNNRLILLYIFTGQKLSELSTVYCLLLLRSIFPIFFLSRLDSTLFLKIDVVDKELRLIMILRLSVEYTPHTC